MSNQFYIHHLYQDPRWSARAAASEEVIISEELFSGGEKIGHVNILKKKLRFLPLYTMRVIFGPDINYNILGHVHAAIEKLRQIAQEHKIVDIEVQPFTWGERTGDIRAAFEKYGFKRTAYKIYEASILIDLEPSEEEIFKQFEQRGREAVRQSQRRGIIAGPVEITDESLDRFYKLYSDTCKRTSMIPETKEKIVSETKYLTGHKTASLFFATYEDKPASGFIAYHCGNCLSLIYQGSDYSEDIQRRRPANCLYWETIRWAKSHGYKWLDLAGVNANPKKGSKSEGIRLYKRQFGGLYVEFPGNFQFVNRKTVYYLIAKILPLYSKIVLNIQRKKLRSQTHE